MLANSKNFRWYVWGFCALFFMYQFILRVSPGILSESLLKDFEIQGCELGILSACFYNSYALMQIPFGILIDRYNPIIIISISCCVVAIASMFFAYSNNLLLASIARLFIGAGAACGFIGVVSIINLHFKKTEVARVIGLTMLFGTIGASLGGAPLRYLTNHIGWRYGLFLIAVIGLFLSAIIGLIAKKYADSHKEKKAKINLSTILHNLSIVIGNKQCWLLGIFGSLMYVPLSAIADLWGPQFIVQKCNISQYHAALISSCIYWGIAFGSPIMTYWSDKQNTRKKPMLYSVIGAVICYTIAIYIPCNSPYLIAFFMFMGGFFFGGQCLVFAMIINVVPKYTQGLAIGFMNMIIMASGSIFEPLIGLLLDYSNNNINADFTLIIIYLHCL